MGLFGPNPQKKGGLVQTRSEAQKQANAEKQKKLDAAKKRAKKEEDDLRNKLKQIERKAGGGKEAGKLSRAERQLLKDNGMWSKVHQQSYTKGAPRW